MKGIKNEKTDGKIYQAHGLKESILTKWLYTQGNLQIQLNTYHITKDILHRIRTVHFKICKEAQEYITFISIFWVYLTWKMYLVKYVFSPTEIIWFYISFY